MIRGGKQSGCIKMVVDKFFIHGINNRKMKIEKIGSLVKNGEVLSSAKGEVTTVDLGTVSQQPGIDTLQITPVEQTNDCSKYFLGDCGI